MRLLTSTSHTRKDLRVSRTGNLLQDTHEVYLRKDIPCGYLQCPLCSPKSDFLSFQEADPNLPEASNNFIIIPDLVGLAQSLDCILNSDIFLNMIVPHSDLAFLQLVSKSAFKKIKTFLELDNHGQMLVFPNRFSADVHAVRLALDPANSASFGAKQLESLKDLLRLARYYLSHLRFVSSLRVVILSDGARLQFFQSLPTHTLAGVEPLSLKQFLLEHQSLSPQHSQTILDSLKPSFPIMVQTLQQHPSLIANESLFQPNLTWLAQELNTQTSNLQDNQSAEPHNLQRHITAVSLKNELQQSVNNGQLFQGKVRFPRNSLESANVGSRVLGIDILITGASNLNQALHGDIVAVEIFSPEFWPRIDQHRLINQDYEQDEQEVTADQPSNVDNSGNFTQNLLNPRFLPKLYRIHKNSRNKTFINKILN